jgi:hypothetical protein
VRLVVARCEVTYSGRLNAYLPEAARLLVFKADGSVLVRDLADALAAGARGGGEHSRDYRQFTGRRSVLWSE